MEVKFGRDGSVGRVVTTVQEVSTAADADAVQAEVMPDEREASAKPRWLPVRREETPTAVVPVRDARSRVDTSDDAISLGEIQLPVLNLVQGVGDLNKTFDPGAFVFNRTVALTKPPKKGANGSETNPPLDILVIGFRPTRWTEKIAGGERGRVVNTEEDVYRIGGSTDYKSTHDSSGNITSPYFERLATALILIRAPADVYEALGDEAADTFPYADAPDPEKPDVVNHYALAQWHLRGAAHTGAAVPLKTARKLNWLKQGYTSKLVKLTCTLKPFGKNSAFVPIVRPGPHATLAERELAAEVLKSLTE